MGSWSREVPHIIWLLKRCPNDPNRVLIKRIIALEGDTVKTRLPYADPEIKIPQGHVWVEGMSLPSLTRQRLRVSKGDESFRTDDSNLYGPIPAALIQSKLVRILWPPERFGPLTEPEIPGNYSVPEYRHGMDAIERKKARRARVRRPCEVDTDTYWIASSSGDIFILVLAIKSEYTINFRYR